MATRKKKAPKKKKTTSRRKDEIDVLVASINKKLKEGGQVQRGEDIDYLEWRRIPSGSLGLDIIMGGGLPCGGITQYAGPESSAKTTTAIHGCALAQGRGENVAWSASEGFNKSWARRNGIYIPYNKKEIAKYELSKKAVMDYNKKHDGYGAFVLTQTRVATTLLDATVDLLRSLQFGIMVLDSAGALLAPEEEDKDLDDPLRVSGNAMLITRFVHKAVSALNRREDGIRNQTSVIIVNQVRDAIGKWSPKGKPDPEPGGGWALKHGKDIDIHFRKGELLAMASRGQKIKYGREVKAKCAKNKTAAPHMDASWYLYFRDVEKLGLKAGTVDLADEVARYGVYYGLIEQSGAWFDVEGERLQGQPALVDFFRENPEVMDIYQQDILEAAEKEA